MSKGLFAVSTYIMALLLFGMGIFASAAITLMLYVIGIFLIISGLAMFAGDGDDASSLGAKLIACAIFAVPGYLIIKFSENLVNSGSFVGLFMGIFFIIFAIVRFKKCLREALEFYVFGFAAVCSFLYPLCMLLAGVCFIFTSVDFLAYLGSLLVIASSVLWIVRTSIIVKDN